MSWQPFVDDLLMCNSDGNHLTSAAIVGHEGSIWAHSFNFPKSEEISAIMKSFDEPGSLYPTGRHLAGTKYMVIQDGRALICGKKGSGGVAVKKFGRALVFGIYEAPSTPGQCNMIVDRLGDYLINQSWLASSKLGQIFLNLLLWKTLTDIGFKLERW